MFYRIPDEFIIEVKEMYDLDMLSSEYRCSYESRENLFEEADEEYINESIKE